MTLITGRQLRDYHCSRRNYRNDGGVYQPNPYYEEFANRRFNYSPSFDKEACRLVFLKDVLQRGNNKTLRRNGRFIWCRNLHYEGRSPSGLRQISFTVDKGKKRFTVSENNMMCVPSKIFISSSPYFRNQAKTFLPFSSVFSYKNTFKMLEKNYNNPGVSFQEVLNNDNPYSPGTLVRARIGYFYPQVSEHDPVDYDDQHPYGIILGDSFVEDYAGREFYRVRFGNTTYERVHPIQLEIINEV
jgi:hypothetical protein